MGACLSGGAPAVIIEATDGGEDAYHQRFLEDQVLGEGEFGVVTMVHDVLAKQEQSVPYASKLLRKGAVFKDNTLYSPIKPHVLKAEIEILRRLQGKRYCLEMIAIFETPRNLYLVTEFCAGGEMMEYVAALSEDLRTEDVSRVAFQLLSAIDHCAQHGIIHRDIKPENCMFQDSAPGAELRLIDFGSGTIKYDYVANNVPEDIHTTFAGSAFYISPEMFQRTYTSKTDVWSVGAAIYVLVAGYPADKLQKAFNLLQKSKRDLAKLPNMPDNMPDSFYELLNALLTFRHKQRPAAADLLSYEFVKFHGEMLDQVGGLSLEDIAAVAASEDAVPVSGSQQRRTMSVSLKGSVGRHNIFLGFKKYERSLTTLLAAMLSKTELNQLLTILKERIGKKVTSFVDSPQPTSEEAAKLAATGGESKTAEDLPQRQEQTLHVVQIRELKTILQMDLKNDQVIEMIEKLPNSEIYNGFAYHVALLKDFSPDGGEGLMGDSTHGRKRSNSVRRRRPQKRRASGGGALRSGGGALMTDSNRSNYSTHSLRSLRSARNNSSKGGVRNSMPASVHGTQVFKRSNSFK